MTIIDKPKKADAKLKSQIPLLNSFEETYKTAYSHGLEMIYSLENVDLRTIRRIEENFPTASESEKKEEIHFSAEKEMEESQYEFDLGKNFRNWIEPIFLKEPIQVLCLSAQAETCLLEHGMKIISDLLAHNSKDYVFMKGMGQGHIDEVKKKLEQFINKRSIKRASNIDFKSLILSLSVGISFKKLSHFASEYQLCDIAPLTFAEKVEIKSFDRSKELAWSKEVKDALVQEDKKEHLMSILENMTQAMILPWINNRGGIATEEEIFERVERISVQPPMARGFLNFISKVFFAGTFPFSSFLYRVEDSIYCSSAEYEKAYRDIIEKALSYFYKSNLDYSLDELTRWILNESCKQWKCYSEDFIHKALSHCPRFTIFRSTSGQLRVALE